ncbi:MAG: hypothetical protein ACKVH8_21770, partial [Pirellulales bacterium]
QIDLFHEFLVNRDVIATELMEVCSHRRSLGQFSATDSSPLGMAVDSSPNYMEESCYIPVAISHLLF